MATRTEAMKSEYRKKPGNFLKSYIKSIFLNRSAYYFMAPFLVIFFTFTVLPVITAMFYSLTKFNILEQPVFIGWDNYIKLFLHDEVFLIAIKNTLLFAAITGPASYFMCLMLAWLVSDLNPKLRSFLTLLFYAPSLANIFFVWQLIFSGDTYGFLNAYLLKLGVITTAIQWFADTRYTVGTVIFVMLWASLGTSFLSFVAGFQNVDRTLYEAGKVDGIRNRWQELWFITLPYMRPQLLFGAVISITGSFGIGSTITALVGFPSTDYIVHTLTNHLDDYGGIRFEMGYACAIATILFFIMIIANKFVQKIIAKVGE